MEIKLKNRIKLFICSVIFCYNVSVLAQTSTERRVKNDTVSINTINLGYKGKEVYILNLDEKTLQNNFGKPRDYEIYGFDNYDDYDKVIEYQYDSLKIYFDSLEDQQWLSYIEFNSNEVLLRINGVEIHVGQNEKALSAFKNSWEVYQQFYNTQNYQEKLKRGERSKHFMLKFLIKKPTYNELGTIVIIVEDNIIKQVNMFFEEGD